jgi:hypothetical protein
MSLHDESLNKDSGNHMPLLSFVIMARNDEYMGNGKWRLEMTLAFLGMNLGKLGRLGDVEIVIVDWQSEVPLHHAVVLTREAAAITRFIVVPHTVEQVFECDFPRPVILNTGIRRARGQYIIQTLGDVLWSCEALARLFEIAGTAGEAERTLYVIGRKEIPYEFVATSPEMAELEAFITTNNSEIIDIAPQPLLRVPADSLMMHRTLWLSSRGFDERLQLWGWSDCDVILRQELKHRVITKREEPTFNVYHLNHIGPGDWHTIETRTTNSWLFNDYTVNGDEWGLGATSIPEFPERTPLIPASAEPLYVNNFRVLHACGVLRFIFQEFSLANAKLAFNCLTMIMGQSPDGSIAKAVYPVFRLLKQRGGTR